MSVLQSQLQSFTYFKNEIYGSLREMEINLKSKFSELESKIKTDLDNLKEKLDTLTSDNNEFKQILIPSKLKLDKIEDLEKFKNKVDDKIITHEIRIKNNFEEIRKFQLRYDQLISQNLFVPGYIGSSCQFKTVADYLYHNINEQSKIKAEREEMLKNLTNLKLGQDNIKKSMISLNESTVQLCNTYTDGKNKVIRQILDSSLQQLNEKSVEMKAMIHQFVENAKKIEQKSKEELGKIIEIKNNISNEIKNSHLELKRYIDDIHKKMKESNSEMNIHKRKMENLMEQMKEVNRNINNINLKLRNSVNSSNIMSGKKKINILSSISPVKDRKFKSVIESDKMSNKNSPKKFETKMSYNKSRNNPEASDIDSIVTENSIVNAMSNQKQTKDLQINTEDNEIIELKEMNYINPHHTISNTNDLNKNNMNNNAINNTINNNTINNKTKTIDSMNNTNSFKISSVQNTKNILKNNTIDINQNKDKDNILPSILKKKEIDGSYYFSEESKKINEENNTITPDIKRSSKFVTTQFKHNSLLKIKNTRIIFQLNNNYGEDNNNNVQKKKRKTTIDRNISTNLNSNNEIKTNNQQKRVTFSQNEEILTKRGTDPYLLKEKEKPGLKLVSLTLSKTESDINKNKTLKDEVSSTIDNYRANAFSNIKNSNENYGNNDEEMLDFPRKVNQAFGRTTYKFISRNDVINHINANKNINNFFEYTNSKNKK